MLKQVILRVMVVCTLALSAVAITGCQTTGDAQPEYMAGETDMPTHERHATGVYSQSAD